jgi:hypothetical protein
MADLTMPRASAALATLVCLGAGLPTRAGPNYDFTRVELEAIVQDLIAWLPGAWDSYPQIHFERRVRTPADGEHDHWHRTFARIDAPQIGPLVFYGQINIGGRDGPLLPRSQILYTIEIDEQRNAVNMNGQGPLDPEAFVNLHERPELWSKVRMRDPGALNCDFLWRRDGVQLFAVLDGKTDDKRKYGPGTCRYNMAGTDIEFFADAEWVLSPDELWDYDINTIGGRQFVGRADRTHIRLYRASGYRCVVSDAAGRRDWHAHNRGARTVVRNGAGADMELMLLRAPMPARDGPGLADRLRLLLKPQGSEKPTTEIAAAADAQKIELRAERVEAICEVSDELPPLTPPPATR